MAKINKEKVQLESFLRTRIREAIAEHLTTLNEWDPEEWDESGDHGPAHGEERTDPYTGQVEFFDGKTNQWISQEEWASMADPEMDASGMPMSELMPGEPDPEDPRSRQAHIDSLLNLEFEENKQLHLEYLDKMIKESVKKFFK